MTDTTEAATSEAVEPTPDAGVRLVVPAEARFLRLARLTAAGLASDLDYGVDAIEDLRIAVDELCAAVIEGADPGSELTVSYREVDGDLVVEGVCADGSSATPELHGVARELLTMLADEFTVGADERGRTFHMVKRRREHVSVDAAARSRTGALFEEYRATGDRKIRNEIVEIYLDVAEYYVKRYSRRGVPADDLRQVSLLTILRAVDRFDPEHGVEFSTFASRTVDGELKRYFRDRTWTVRPPRRSQELHLALRKTDEELTQRLGRSPTVAELAHELDESVDHVLEALEAGVAHQGTSIDQSPVGDDGDPARRSERMLSQGEAGYGHVDRRLIIGELLEDLSERDRQVIEMRFFQNRTQEEIANEIGVSQSYLSRILRRVLIDLREKLGDDWDAEAF